MGDSTERDAFARRVFSGLIPSADAQPSINESQGFRSSRLGKGVMVTVPMVLAGAMTVSMNLTGPLESASAATKRPAKAELSKSLREAAPAVKVSSTGATSGTTVTSGTVTSGTVTTASRTPSNYTVSAGDTVSSIAGRHGLSTASVLAVNGLSWKSLIFPGQVLKLSIPALAAAAVPTAAVTSGGRYTIRKGDSVGAIASRFGVTTQAVLTANGLSRTSIIYPGQTIAIPSGMALSIQTVAAITPAPASAVPAPVTPAPASAAGTSYTIRAGDTVSLIAARFGVPVAALLTANGLTGSSVIYAGRTMTIPGAGAPAAATSTSPANGLTAEMTANARTIIRTGQRLGVPDRGIVIALAAAAQESGLRNLSYGDRDSIGIFQQRPRAGWGSNAQLLNVEYAAQLFYGGPSNPNAGRTRGLLDIAGWQSMSVTQAAQAVQLSAFPTAYAKWETIATAWFAQYK